MGWKEAIMGWKEATYDFVKLDRRSEIAQT